MPASLLIDLFSGDFYVWWLSSAKEVLFGMLAYVSKIFAVVQFNKEEFPVISSVSHIRDQALVFITKTWGGEKHLSPHPHPRPYHASFPHLLILELEGEGRRNELITGGGEKLCGVFHWLIIGKMYLKLFRKPLSPATISPSVSSLQTVIKF